MPYVERFCLRFNTYQRQNPMQLDTITELLDIPNYKTTHLIHNDGNSLHFIIDLIHCRPFVPGVDAFMTVEFTINA